MKRPSILIANDDGIFADGIYALWEAMSDVGETTVVAPNTEKSAVGHAITISDPIRIEKVKRSGGFTSLRRLPSMLKTGELQRQKTQVYQMLPELMLLFWILMMNGCQTRFHTSYHYSRNIRMLFWLVVR